MCTTFAVSTTCTILQWVDAKIRTVIYALYEDEEQSIFSFSRGQDIELKHIYVSPNLLAAQPTQAEVAVKSILLPLSAVSYLKYVVWSRWSPAQNLCFMLAKFWFQTVLFVGCGSGKSFLIELIVAATALEVEERSNSDKYLIFFQIFWIKVSDIMTLKIIFTVYHNKVRNRNNAYENNFWFHSISRMERITQPRSVE